MGRCSHTDAGRDWWEQVARLNLTAEIKELNS
jgi:predicted metal-dependent HD superfamily phosphohydrolase